MNVVVKMQIRTDFFLVELKTGTKIRLPLKRLRTLEEAKAAPDPLQAPPSPRKGPNKSPRGRKDSKPEEQKEKKKRPPPKFALGTTVSPGKGLPSYADNFKTSDVGIVVAIYDGHLYHVRPPQGGMLWYYDHEIQEVTYTLDKWSRVEVNTGPGGWIPALVVEKDDTRKVFKVFTDDGRHADAPFGAVRPLGNNLFTEVMIHDHPRWVLDQGVPEREVVFNRGDLKPSPLPLDGVFDPPLKVTHKNEARIAKGVKQDAAGATFVLGGLVVQPGSDAIFTPGATVYSVEGRPVTPEQLDEVLTGQKMPFVITFRRPIDAFSHKFTPEPITSKRDPFADVFGRSTTSPRFPAGGIFPMEDLPIPRSSQPRKTLTTGFQPLLTREATNVSIMSGATFREAIKTGVSFQSRCSIIGRGVLKPARGSAKQGKPGRGSSKKMDALGHGPDGGLYGERSKTVRELMKMQRSGKFTVKRQRSREGEGATIGKWDKLEICSPRPTVQALRRHGSTTQARPNILFEGRPGRPLKHTDPRAIPLDPSPRRSRGSAINGKPKGKLSLDLSKTPAHEKFPELPVGRMVGRPITAQVGPLPPTMAKKDAAGDRSPLSLQPEAAGIPADSPDSFGPRGVPMFYYPSDYPSCNSLGPEEMSLNAAASKAYREGTLGSAPGNASGVTRSPQGPRAHRSRIRTKADVAGHAQAEVLQSSTVREHSCAPGKAVAMYSEENKLPDLPEAATS